MPINWSGIEMPQFNYRLRRAVDPSRFGSTQFDLTDPEQEQDNFQIPDFSRFRDKTGPSMDTYKQHLASAPNERDYQPTKWRRAAAVLAGIGAAFSGKDAYTTTRDINLDPYKQAYERWAEKGQGLGAAATLESNDSARQATFWQKVMSDYMDQGDKREQRNIQRGNLENQVNQTKIQQARAEIEAERVAGVITNAEAANRIRILGINVAAGTARRGQDINAATQKYGIEQRSYAATKGRELDALQGKSSPSYSPATDMIRFEQDAVREYLAKNPEIKAQLDTDDSGRIDYESIVDPILRQQVMDDIARGIKFKQANSRR